MTGGIATVRNVRSGTVARVEVTLQNDVDALAVGADPVRRWDGQDVAAVLMVGSRMLADARTRCSKDTTMRSSSRWLRRGHQTTIGLSALIASATACVDEDVDAPTNYDTDSDTGMCEPEPQDGEWNPALIDWLDPGEPGDTPKSAPFDDIVPHHPYMTAVHAAHLPTGDLILFHGQGDQRLWPIGSAASQMLWHPLPYTVGSELCSYEPPPGFACYADIFCAGHVVLPDGRLFVAGGNVNGSDSGGGLVNTFTFDPWTANAGLANFGWDDHDDMAVDRWYPTLTVIPGENPATDAMGRVLISSGASRVGGGQNTFELFDPENGQVSQLAIGGTSPFTLDEPIPYYPFIFLLPNGDIMYAGGEGASDAVEDGRVLIPDYNNGGTWKWNDTVFESNINGGSAVMYEPGKILKSGGLRNDLGDNIDDNFAHPMTETIDLSGFESDAYVNAPDFNDVEREDMNRSRHMHTLTLLADGRVVATGGNTHDNGQTGDHTSNACNYLGDPIIGEACSDADLDGVPDPGTAGTGCPAVPSRCSGGDCPFLALPPPDPCQSSACGADCDAQQSCAMEDPEDCCAPDENCNEFGFCQQNECHDIDGDDTPDAESCGAPCSVNSDCPPGSTCATHGNCVMPCPEGTGTCGAVVHCTDGASNCDPANNACNATRTAEIWEPKCGTWTEITPSQQRPRMYHSTALLIPDGRVISMGGGHRQGLDEQYNAEFFEPEYGAAGSVNIPEFDVVAETNMENDAPALPWDGEAMISFSNGSGSLVADEFTLVRLGSVTHQFDMDQRFLRLGKAGDVDVAGPLTVPGPESTDVGPAAAIAPPGYYMLFLRTADGEVSTGQYVKVGPMVSKIYVCPATLDLEATETSCTTEPMGGTCPGGSVQQNGVDLPIVDSPPGPVEGWHVLVPAGEIDDPLAPTANELAALDARCIAACEAEYESNPAVAANCDDPDAFDTPIYFYDGAAGPYDLVLPAQKQGEGVFAGNALTCQLDSTCYSAFDEDLAAAMPDRTTPANDLLGVGEEYRIALGGLSKVEIITNGGTYSSRLTGSIGYSFCRDGNASAACPFYLGSFEALAASNITATMTCADKTTARPTISNLLVKLSQPAFGIAKSGSTTTSKGFPKGGLIFESAFDVGREHVTSRRPSRANAVMTASGPTFNASNLTVTMEVPCNNSTANITVRLTARDPGNGSAIGKPPVVTNTTATTGTCGGPRALTATVTDPNGDAGPVRWRVDGVLMAPGTSTILVTGSHTLEAVVRDGRGATTTAKKVVSCS